MELNKKLWDERKKKKVLIAAHRGTCGGNVIQNTVLAYENALQHGADMVEIDVIKSNDGIFYAFHNGHEKDVLGIDRDIREMSSQEIDECHCLNALAQKVEQRLQRLDEIMPKLKNRCFINIDRSWFYWQEVIEKLESYHMGDQIILKSPVERTLLQQLQDSKANLMYMPIVKSKEELAIVKEYDVNLVAAELIFEQLDHELVDPAFMESLNKDGIMSWVNAITLNDEIVLSGNLDDNHAIAEGYEANWGKLIDMGFDIIQTDWPGLLSQFIKR